MAPDHLRRFTFCFLHSLSKATAIPSFNNNTQRISQSAQQCSAAWSVLVLKMGLFRSNLGSEAQTVKLHHRRLRNSPIPNFIEIGHWALQVGDYFYELAAPLEARRPMVLDHLADHWSGPVQWTNGPDQSEVLMNGPELVQGIWTTGPDQWS